MTQHSYEQPVRRVLLVILCVVAVLIAYSVWLGVLGYMNAQRSLLVKNQLKQIGLALHSYHDKYECFPPAYVRGPDGTPWHSWRTLLLPYLQQENLYEEYRFDEPWNGPHNSQLIAKQPEVFRSPRQQSNRIGVAGYLGVVSRRTVWPAYFSAKAEDVSDGNSNTIQLLEYPQSDIIWTEPRDLREHEALSLLAATNSGAKPTLDIKVFGALMCDGFVRNVSVNIDRDLFISLLTPRYRGSLVPNDVWPAGLLTADLHADRSLPALVEGQTIDGVQQVLTPWVSSDPNKTTLYCATMQIAWDQLRPAPGEPVVATSPLAELDDLNRYSFPLTALDPGTYQTRISDFDTFAKSTPLVSPEVADRGKDSVKDTEGEGFVIECHLHKLAKYPEAMFRFMKPLLFTAGEQKGAVASFGWPGSQEAAGEMALPALTVTIPSYHSPEDFVVVLSTTTGRSDEIVLARVPLESSLHATWNKVRERLTPPPKPDPYRSLRSVDTLQIPVLSIAINDEFEQLKGLAIGGGSGRRIEMCRQSIQLKLDEFGAELLADNLAVVGENGFGPQEDPSRPKMMIFDRPFYMAMRERESSEPYFQAWIASPTIMEPMGP
jgi:hypothetical protein